MSIVTEADLTFSAMGSDVRLMIGLPLAAGRADPAVAAEAERRWIMDFARRLSRFVPDSELSRLNAAGQETVPASALLRAAVSAGLWAAQRSAGLVDPTLTGALRRVGYTASREGQAPASLSEALAAAPPRAPARPARPGAWRAVQVDDQAGTITRPAGTQLDTGGTGKGLCADAVVARLGAYRRCLVDCGGDIAVGGVGAQLEPYTIGIEHPLSAETVGSIALGRGGVATSGLNVRLWADSAGGYQHHLLDPSTGRPAWTGLIGVTAVSPDGALAAETLAKMALLLGPAGARDVLNEHGGLTVADDGTVELVGPLAFTAVDGAVTA
ncbi:MAG TPA: FAD:protein FMN transferase [Solirubrobacteraceae bacterium]|nr:FAD:protein FMN transferase [Solirubrobacteraceae bacterium]